MLVNLYLKINGSIIHKQLSQNACINRKVWAKARSAYCYMQHVIIALQTTSVQSPKQNLRRPMPQSDASSSACWQIRRAASADSTSTDAISFRILRRESRPSLWCLDKHNVKSSGEEYRKFKHGRRELTSRVVTRGGRYSALKHPP